MEANQIILCVQNVQSPFVQTQGHSGKSCGKRKSTRRIYTPGGGDSAYERGGDARQKF